MKNFVKMVISFILILTAFGLTNTSSVSAATSFIKPSAGVYYSTFGYRESTGTFHAGIDISTSAPNTAVNSSAAGVVRTTGGGCSNNGYYGSTCNGGWGNYIIVRHSIGGKTYDTVYAHLSQISVSAYQSVAQGQRIGTMGNSGSSTGQHLHFELHPGGRVGSSSAVDPMPYLTGDASPAPTQPIPHSYDGTWATLRTTSPTGSSTVNTFGHVGYGINGTLPTGNLYRVYEKAAASDGTDYFKVGYEKWVHRDNSIIKPYVATAKYTSPALDVPGGTKVAALDRGDKHKVYGAAKTSNGRAWYLVGNLGWVDASYLDVVRIP